ncbi:ribosomal RNA processing protein 36 homolog [Heptranchias perlo]|uniref:ribosomal RNA processing protein 36 homolog n=1 Tax=Heptranchias perlo TaxID=212740 RepID=UPI003559E483
MVGGNRPGAREGAPLGPDRADGPEGEARRRGGPEAASSEGEDGDPGGGEASDQEGEGDPPGSSDSSDTDSSTVGGDRSTGSIKGELSTLSFEDLQKLQSKVGLKAYNQMAYGTGKGGHGEKRKRPHKDSPMEMSTKQPVPFLRKVVPVKKRMVRDPRFDDLSGEYKPEIFDQTYAFLSDVRNNEEEIIKKKLKKMRNPKKKQELEYLLQRMIHQDKAQENKRLQRERLKEFKQKQRERVHQGSRPFFLKKSEQRRLELAEKYRELKRVGKLESFLGKKRKRNATKDRRHMPVKKPG